MIESMRAKGDEYMQLDCNLTIAAATQPPSGINTSIIFSPFQLKQNVSSDGGLFLNVISVDAPKPDRGESWQG